MMNSSTNNTIQTADIMQQGITDLVQMSANLSKFQYYFLIAFLTPSGCIGNIISITVFLRKTFRETAMGKYLIALSVCDILYQAYSINNFIIMVFEPIICQFMWILNVSCMIFNGLIKSVVSIDRMILVRFPTRFHFIKKTWFQLSVIGFLASLAGIPVVTAQGLINYETFRNNFKQCFVGIDAISQIAIAVSRSIDLYIGNVLTFCIMLISGIIILRKLSVMSLKSKKVIGNKKDRILTIFTVFSISYFLLMSALYIGVVVYQLYFYNPKIPNGVYLILIQIGAFLKNIEMNTSFFIYIFFNRLYRSELFEILNGLLFIISRGKYGGFSKKKKSTLKLKKLNAI